MKGIARLQTATSTKFLTALAPEGALLATLNLAEAATLWRPGASDRLLRRDSAVRWHSGALVGRGDTLRRDSRRLSAVLAWRGWQASPRRKRIPSAVP